MWCLFGDQVLGEVLEDLVCKASLWLFQRLTHAPLPLLPLISQEGMHQRVWHLKELQTIQTQHTVRGVSWSEVATVPKRKSHRALDFNLSWNSEEDIWKGWKKSNGTKRKRRRVKRSQPEHNAQVHMHGWDDACKADLSQGAM